MRMKKSNYAKGKIIHAMLKVNMDNYRCYLPARVQIFKSSEQDSSLVLFILQVHLLVLEMETLMVAPLVTVTLMMMPPSLSTPAWSMDLILAELVEYTYPSQLLLLVSWGVDCSSIEMLGVSSWSGSSLAIHKWYSY